MKSVILPDIEQAAHVLSQGGIVVYPTETFYGLAASVAVPETVSRLAGIKNRTRSKPIPLIIGDTKFLTAFSPVIDDDLRRLGEIFWPGPLSVLVRDVGRVLPPEVTDEDGYVSVRVSSNPDARKLSNLLQAPVTATSANYSGRPPAATPEELDPGLLAEVEGAYLGGKPLKGGLPSTVVRIVESGVLRIIRPGAVAARELTQAGFSLI